MDNHLKTIEDAVNQASRAHATNYLTVIYALMEKGVITHEEMEAARETAKKVVDEHFGPTLEEKSKAQLAERMKSFQPSEAV